MRVTEREAHPSPLVATTYSKTCAKSEKRKAETQLLMPSEIADAIAQSYGYGYGPNTPWATENLCMYIMDAEVTTAV
jgi:hypothetical protein